MRSATRHWTWVAAGIVAAACAVRIIGLSDRSFWLDEAFSALYARVDLSTLVEMRRRGTNPPLYHVLLGIWASGFGDGEASLRSFSVIAGTAAVGLCMLLGRSIGGWSVGLLAGGLLAINSMAVGYSQEARYYALIELLAVGSAMLLRRAVLPRGARWMAGYAAVMVVFVWVHLFAWFLLIAHAIALLWACRKKSETAICTRRTIRAFGIALAVILVSFLPWASVLAMQVQTVLSDYWIRRPGWSMPLVCLHSYVVPLAELRWPVVVAAVGIGTWILMSRRSNALGADAMPKRCAFDGPLLWCWAVVPIAIPLGWSYLFTPIFQVKYTLGCQPAILILVAMLIRRRPVIGSAALAAMVAVHAPWPNRGLDIEDWRTAAAVIKTNAEPDETIYVCKDYTYVALAYYLDDDEHRLVPVIAPQEHASEFVSVFTRGPLEFADFVTELEQCDSAWIVLSRVEGGPLQPMIVDRLREFGQLVHFPVRGDVDVIRWHRKPF